MRLRPPQILTVIALVALVACTASSPATPPPTGVSSPPTNTPTREPAPTDTPIPPTATPIPTATATLVPPTATLMPPTATPRPATHTVCAAGCDFATIQGAIDRLGVAQSADAGQSSGVIIEVTDPVHTEPGIVFGPGVQITVRGLGWDRTVVQAHETLEGSPERVFLVEEGAVVTLERMTIRHGRPSVEDEHGGGIDNHGVLMVRGCVVTKNSARGGGGISNREGTLTIIGSTFSDNVARGDGPRGVECGGGGGVKCSSGRMTLVGSTVTGNQAGLRSEGLGGGVRTGCGCVAEIMNTTISGNQAVRYGGGIAAAGRVTITHCTITQNAVGTGGGALWIRGEVSVQNTIVAENRGGRYCVVHKDSGGQGTLALNISNLIGDGSCSPLLSGDPMLGRLEDNGGDTLTHALLPGSPAIDAVPAISCTLPTDQRGALRPMVLTSPETPCDIGAFEVQPETSTETSDSTAPSSQMLLVPAGEFTMGSDDGRGDEQPVHRVILDAFAIDRTEVTNAQFARFLSERGNREEGGETWLDVDDEDCLINQRGSHFQPKSGFEDHPVIEVTWYGAGAYCEWRGEEESAPLRLPTEAEWEKAASWDAAADVKCVYPWGDAWDCSVVNADWPITATTELRPHTAPVGSYPEGASPYGMLDMAGNVWEWVADWYASDYYAYSSTKNPQGPDTGEDKVLRGGSWRSPGEFVRTTVRHHWFPDYTFDIGFRCARSLQGSAEP